MITTKIETILRIQVIMNFIGILSVDNRAVVRVRAISYNSIGIFKAEISNQFIIYIKKYIHHKVSQLS